MIRRVTAKNAHHHADLDRPVLERAQAGSVGQLLVNARVRIQEGLDVRSDGLHLGQVLVAHPDRGCELARILSCRYHTLRTSACTPLLHQRSFMARTTNLGPQQNLRMHTSAARYKLHGLGFSKLPAGQDMEHSNTYGAEHEGTTGLPYLPCNGIADVGPASWAREEC